MASPGPHPLPPHHNDPYPYPYLNDHKDNNNDHKDKYQKPKYDKYKTCVNAQKIEGLTLKMKHRMDFRL